MIRWVEKVLKNWGAALQSRASIENPSIPITDSRVWSRYFGNQEADSGMVIDVDRLLSYSPIWAGVRMLSSDIAQMPLYVYRRIDQGKERDKMHPAFRLLRRRVNEEMTATTWKQIVMTHALIYGRSYSWIARNQGGQPVALYPIHPDRVRLLRVNGKLRYILDFQDRPDLPSKANLPPRDVFQILGLTLAGTDGLSLIEYARNSVGRGLAAEKYSNRFFRNNARPGGILVHPNRLDDVAINNLRESIGQLHEGLDNAHRFMILEEGMQWQQTGINPEESQLIESLEFGVKDAARVLGIPPHRLGDDSKTSFASLEQENLSYQQSSLGPWFDKIQEECYAKLLTPGQQDADTHTIEFERNKILQADAKTRHEVYAIGLSWGFYNRDEVRGWENMNSLPDGEGEKYYVPLNVAVAGEEPEPAPEAEAPQEPEGPVDEPEEQDDERSIGAEVVAAQRKLMDHAARRAAARLAHYFDRAAASGKTFCRELDGIDRHAEVILDMFAPVVDSIRSVGLPCPDADELAQRYLDMWGRAMDGIAKTCAEDELGPAVAEMIKTLRDGGVKILPEGQFDGTALHE